MHMIRTPALADIMKQAHGEEVPSCYSAAASFVTVSWSKDVPQKSTPCGTRLLIRFSFERERERRILRTIEEERILTFVGPSVTCVCN